MNVDAADDRARQQQHQQDAGFLRREILAGDDAGLAQPPARRDPAATREELERQTLSYLATMPAWRDHPRVARGG